MHCHQVFFSSLCPPGKRTVPDRVSKALCQCFGSFQQFQEQFDKAACHFFGSGFVWLVMLPTNYRLVIRISYGYEIPLSEGGCPLLCLDLWEHAYCRCLTLQDILKHGGAWSIGMLWKTECFQGCVIFGNPPSLFQQGGIVCGRQGESAFQP